MILIESRAARDGSQTAPKRLEREADWENRLPVEFLFHAVLADLPLPVFIKEAVGLQYIFWNRAGQELTGLAPAEFFGKSDHDLFPKEQADRSAARDRLVLAAKGPISFTEEEMETRHGRRVVHTREISISGQDGRPVRAGNLRGYHGAQTRRRSSPTGQSGGGNLQPRQERISGEHVPRNSH